MSEREPGGGEWWVESPREQPTWPPPPPNGGERPQAPEPAPPPAPEPEERGVALPALAGLIVAVAGAAAWGFAARLTDTDLGILAWAIGIAVGLAVALAAGSRRSPELQSLGVVLTLVGALAGKYLAFALPVAEDTSSPFGTGVGVFSGEMVDLFRGNLAEVFGLLDLLWIGLGAVSAWYVLRPPVDATAAGEEPADRDRPPEFHSRNPVDRLTRGLPHGWRVTIDWVVTIVGAIAIVLAIKAWVVNPYRIPSSSMEPTLHCARPANGCEASFSDRVLANRFIYHFREPKRGDIVVFETPPEAQVKCGAGGTFVKRLIGLPGEKVEIRLRRGNGFVYINGQQLQEPYVQDNRRDPGPAKSFTVPAGHYFMMGDNRSQSCDSRIWGAVPRENLIGKVFATYWPPNRISLR